MFINSIPQGLADERQERDDPFLSLFDAVLGRVGMLKKQRGDDDWDDYISQEEHSESPQSPCDQHDSTVPFPGPGGEVMISVTADGEEDDDDIYWDDNETNVALAIYDVLSSPASVEAEEDAADAVLGVQDECEDDYIARCADDDEIDEEPNHADHMEGMSTDIFQMFSGMQSLTGPVEENVYYFRRRLMESEEHQKKLARTSKGMKLLHDLRDMVVPPSILKAVDPVSLEDRINRKLAGQDRRRQNISSGNGRRNSIHSGRLSRRGSTDMSAEAAASHEAAEMEKLELLRAEYGHNPNRNKLSTRLSPADRQRQRRERTRRLFDKDGGRARDHEHFHHDRHDHPPSDGPADGKPKPKPKPKSGPGGSEGGPPPPPPPPPPADGDGKDSNPVPADGPPAVTDAPPYPREGEGGKPKPGPSPKNGSKPKPKPKNSFLKPGPAIVGKPKPHPSDAAPSSLRLGAQDSHAKDEVQDERWKQYAKERGAGTTTTTTTRRLEMHHPPNPHAPPREGSHPAPPPPNPHERFGGPFLWMGPRAGADEDIDDGSNGARDDEDIDDGGDDARDDFGDDDSDLSRFLSRPMFSAASHDVYTGSLGYGTGGDKCMYRAYPKLSRRCKAAITDLYDFREEYVQMNPMAMSASPYHYVKHHGDNPLVAISFVTMLVLGLFVTFKRRQKNQQIRRVLDVIDGNASLKAQVEALAGCEIPTHNSGWKTLANILRSGFKGVFYIVSCLVMCFVIAVVSLITTGQILGAMYNLPPDCDELPDDDERCQGPSAFVALFILFAVIAVNMCLCAMALRACRCVSDRNIASLQPAPAQGAESHPNYVALSGTENEMGTVHHAPTVVSSTTTTTTTKQHGVDDPEQQPSQIVTGRLVRAVPVSSSFSMI